MIVCMRDIRLLLQRSSMQFSFVYVSLQHFLQAMLPCVEGVWCCKVSDHLEGVNEGFAGSHVLAIVVIHHVEVSRWDCARI